jgi:hypothetical protein
VVNRHNHPNKKPCLKTIVLTIAAIGVVSTLVAAIAPSIGKVIEYKTINDKGANLKSPEEVPFAKQQADIWQRNIDCTGVNQRWLDAGQLKFSAVFCPDTGDILVQYKLNPTGKQYVHWIAEDDRQGNSKIIGFLSSPAHASLVSDPKQKTAFMGPAHLIAQEFRSIYQKQASEGKIVRIVQKTNGQCTRQTINSYSGQVSSESIGKCTPGYCTFLASSKSERTIVNDKCIVGKVGSSRIDLTWSSGQAMKITLNPASIDGAPGRIIQPHSRGATIKSKRGNVGWCWDCKP